MRFIFWLRYMVKTAAFRSYRGLFYVFLRLIRYCQSIVNGKEEDFRKRPGGLAFSQSGTNQPDSQPAPPVSLAVPLLERGSQPPTDIITPDHITLIPITPLEVNRYGRNVRVKDEYEAFLVEKGPLDCSEELAPVAGWEPLTQPEGAMIFYQPYKRVFTDVDVRDPQIRVKIDKAVEKAYHEARNAGIFLDPFVELGLELIVKDGEEMWGYYFVDHKKRIIFWFEDHRSDSLMSRIRGVERKSHIKYALESQYWRHIELFPNRRFLPEDIVVELKEFVMYAQADSITSQTSVVQFASDEIANILSLVDLLRKSANKNREHSVWIAARIMKHLCETKFVNFYGQPGTRLDVEKSLYGKSDAPKNKLSRAINAMIGRWQESKAFHKVWVDGRIVHTRWEQYMDKLNSDWNGYTIFSTVMVAVDVSFLAVPSVQTQDEVIILLYTSTFSAMCSLLITLSLVTQVNEQLRGSNTAVVSYLSRMAAGSVLDSESFPFMLSLPFGFLMLGVSCFIGALLSAIIGIFTFPANIIIYLVLMEMGILVCWLLRSTSVTFVWDLLWYLLRMWYRNTSRFIVYLWNRIIERVSPTVTTPLEV
ncbi:hypothetical protein C8R48DRAFT_687549 [Suillus tomentosus]|nr:hypothetical protein C8R48DRAFT_687549 [Suillus tomentosus]